MGAEREIDHAIVQEKPGPLVFPQRIESHVPPEIRYRCPARLPEDDGTAKLLGARGDVERMQPLHPVRAFLGLGNHVDRSAGRINDRRAGDSDFEWGCRRIRPYRRKEPW